LTFSKNKSGNFQFYLLFCLPHKKVTKKVTVDDKFAVLQAQFYRRILSRAGLITKAFHFLL